MEIKQVRLHGPLGEKYGKVHNLKADNISLAISNINYNNKGFRNEIRSGTWQFEIDGQKILKDDLNTPRFGEVIDIYPAVIGEKSSDQTNANILGAVLLVASIATGGAASPFLVAASPFLARAGVLALTYGYTLGLVPDELETGNGSLNSRIGGTNSENAPIPTVFGRYLAQALRVSLEITQERRV